MAEETPLWTIVFDFRLQFIGEEYWRDYDRGYEDSIHSHHEGANVSTNVLPIMAPVDKLFENIIRVHVGKVKRF